MDVHLTALALERQAHLLESILKVCQSRSMGPLAWSENARIEVIPSCAMILWIWFCGLRLAVKRTFSASSNTPNCGSALLGMLSVKVKGVVGNSNALATDLRAIPATPFHDIP